MAARTQQKGDGVWEAWGIVLLALCLLISLSLFSYDWRDISVLNVPANSPPYNFIGPVGAWMSYILLSLLGLAAYIVPIWCLFYGVAFLFRWERQLWPRLPLFTRARPDIIAQHD